MATSAAVNIELDTSLDSPHHSPEESPPGQVRWNKLARTVHYMKKFSLSSEETSTAKDRSEFMVKHKYNDETLAEDGWVAVTKKNRFVFKPNKRYFYWWLFIVTLSVLYNGFVIVARQTFKQLQATSWRNGFWLTLDYTADIIYITDTIIQFRTGFLEQGLLETEPSKMAKYYLKSFAFKLDIASIVPFEIFLYFFFGTKYTIMRINRVLRSHRVLMFFQRTDNSTNWPNTFRLFILLLYLSIIIHWNACFYFQISKWIGFGDDQWVYPMMEGNNATDDEYSNLFRQYIVSLYWSTLTLTTIGEVPGPVTNVEYTFVVLDYLLGVLVFASIIGMVGDISSNMTSQRASFQCRLDNIKQYMKFRKVGKDLQKRVVKWFDYLWITKHTMDENEILNSLPDKLHAEISIHVNFALLRKIDIFEHCESGMLEELVLKLNPQVYSPGDYICRKGDVGREMFIVKKGKLQVSNGEGEILGTLTDGSHFGEISVLHLSKKGNRRTASVKSVGFSDLFSLSKNDLLEVLEEYPKARRQLQERGRRILIADGTIEEGEIVPLSMPPPLLVQPHHNYFSIINEKIISLANKIEQLEEIIRQKEVTTPTQKRMHNLWHGSEQLATPTRRQP